MQSLVSCMHGTHIIHMSAVITPISMFACKCNGANSVVQFVHVYYIDRSISRDQRSQQVYTLHSKFICIWSSKQLGYLGRRQEKFWSVERGALSLETRLTWLAARSTQPNLKCMMAMCSYARMSLIACNQCTVTSIQ